MLRTLSWGSGNKSKGSNSQNNNNGSPYQKDESDTDDDFVDYPMTSKMDGTRGADLDNSENSDGWSDDSGQTSDDDVNALLGRRKSNTPSGVPKNVVAPTGGDAVGNGTDGVAVVGSPQAMMPPAAHLLPEHTALPIHPKQMGRDKNASPPVRTSSNPLSRKLRPPSDLEEDESDDDDPFEHGGMNPYMLSKERSKGRNLVEAQQTNDRPPSPPSVPGSPGNASKPGMLPLVGTDIALATQHRDETRTEPTQYIGYRGLDATRKAIPREIVPESEPYPDQQQQQQQYQQQQYLQPATMVQTPAPTYAYATPPTPQEYPPVSPRRSQGNDTAGYRRSPRQSSPRKTVPYQENNNTGNADFIKFSPAPPRHPPVAIPTQQQQQQQPDLLSGTYDQERAAASRSQPPPPQPVPYGKPYEQDRDEEIPYGSASPMRYYDPNRDPRNYPETTSIPPPPIHKAIYPDADDSELGPEQIRRRGDDSVSFLGSTKAETRMMLGLILCLGCALILLAALVGGIIGAMALGKSDDPSPAIVVPVPTPAPMNPIGPTPPPVNPVDPPPQAEPTPDQPTTDETTSSPTAVTATESPTTAPTLAPTDDPNRFPKDQALFDLISSRSADNGLSMQTPDTPQNKAYLWLESDSYSQPLSENRKIQRYALATFYYSTQGEQWPKKSAWLEAMDECVWHTDTTSSFSCEGEVFTVLELKENNVVGTLPPELGLLSGLKRLAILNTDGATNGGLTGGLPKELGQVTTMLDLEMSGNTFSEPFPPELFEKWNKLDKLLVENNQIPGPLPTSVGALVTIQRFNVARNQLTGALPTELGQMTDTRNFFAAGNQFTGTIPSEMGLMVQIRAGLHLSGNQLSGVIPDTLNALSLLRSLQLHDNILIGPVPDLSALTSLTLFRVDGNSLTGAIPPGTCAAARAAADSQVYADCSEVTCECCTHCCIDGNCVPSGA